MRILIVGLPNSGKSTLFNRLCRAHRRTGNFAGITVSAGDGRLRDHDEIRLTDLPGCYSLSDRGEGALTAEVVQSGDWDAAAVVCDAAAPERAAGLLVGMREAGRPLCLCCNFADELRRSGGRIDTDALSEIFNLPVFALSARTGEGVTGLIEWLCAPSGGIAKADGEITTARREKEYKETADNTAVTAPGNANNKIDRTDGRTAPRTMQPSLAGRPLSAAGVSAMPAKPCFSTDDRTPAKAAAKNTDADIARMAGRAAAAVTRQRNGRSARRDALDRLLCGRWGWLFFLAAAGLLFFSLRLVSSGRAADLTETVCEDLTEGAELLLASAGLAPPLCAFLCRGVLGGVTAVLGFLPPLFVLFFGLALTEDSGYGARTVFLFDAPMRRWGLSGECAFPLLLGFGCTVTGALSCRTVPHGRVRDRTLCTLPCLSCSAKLPVYLFAASAAGAAGGGWLLWLYPAGIAAAALQVTLTKKLFSKESKTVKNARNPSPFLLEMPPLRFPSLSVALKVALRRTAEFIGRVMLPVTLCTAVLWALSHFSPSFSLCASPENSLLRCLCGLPSVLLAPAGCGDWRLTASLACGLFAKETAGATLSVLLAGEKILLSQAVPYCLLVLLWPPCLHAQFALWREMQSKRLFAFGLVFQLAAGYLAAVLARLVLLAFGL